MKKLLIAMIVLLFSSSVIAQDAVQWFTIHEVKVRPSKDVAYREAAKKLKAACEQHKVNITWTGFVLEDNTYVYSLPIKSMADLDKNFFAELETKMGKANLDKIWAEIDANSESVRDYAVSTVKGMTHLAPIPGDKEFRTFLFWTPETGKDAEALKVMEDFKSAYVAKNSPHGFVVYKTGYGASPGYIIVSWAKDAVDAEVIIQKRNEALGYDEIEKLWSNMQSITRSFESKTGWRVKDLSYTLAKPN